MGQRHRLGPARLGGGEFREAEVQHLHHAVLAHLDVRRFEIAMRDAQLVRRFERVGDLLRNRQGFGHGDRPIGDPIRQGRALDQLHDERADGRLP